MMHQIMLWELWFTNKNLSNLNPLQQTVQEKIRKRFLKVKINSYSWEKKTKVKVHLQNFWNLKGTEKQKCSSWYFEITMCLQNIYFFIGKVNFFSKEGEFLKLFFQIAINYEFLWRIVAKFKASLLFQYLKL